MPYTVRASRLEEEYNNPSLARQLRAEGYDQQAMEAEGVKPVNVVRAYYVGPDTQLVVSPDLAISFRRRKDAEVVAADCRQEGFDAEVIYHAKKRGPQL